MKAAQSEVTQPIRSNPGDSLRQAREARGLSVGLVAEQLNLTVQRLAQIEAGEFEQLPGMTFARGYIRAYAKLLGLDQNRLVLEFDQFTGTDAAGSNVHSLGRIEEPVRYSQRILRLVSFLLLLALIGGGFLWWQDQGRPVASLADLGLEQVLVDGADGTTQVHSLAEPEDQAVLAAQGSQQVDPLPLPAEPQALTETAGDAEVPVGEAVVIDSSEVASAVESAAVPVPSEPAVVAPQPAPVVAPVEPPVAAEAPAPVAAAAGQGVIGLQFTADCWTQVTDADGKVLLSALKRSGEHVELTGKVPMELRLGFARGAQVSYNGASVDVSPYTSGETARLKLGL